MFLQEPHAAAIIPANSLALVVLAFVCSTFSSPPFVSVREKKNNVATTELQTTVIFHNWRVELIFGKSVSHSEYISTTKWRIKPARHLNFFLKTALVKL
jgi:hypothetical protein